MAKWLALIVGSAFGGVGRYALSGLVYALFGSGFAYGTLAVNLIGCFLIGILAALSEQKFLLGPNARMLLMIGFCGAFTTFSTFMLETVHLIKDGEIVRGLLNVSVSVMLGFLLVVVGMFVGECL